MGQANIKRKSILIVEDEPSIAKVCTKTLSAEGFEAEIVADGKAALKVLTEKEFDLCLIDIRTPEMNGTELYHHLKEMRPEMESKIIFTTGDVLNAYTKAFLEKANKPYLTKPFTPDELRAIVRTVLV